MLSLLLLLALQAPPPATWTLTAPAARATVRRGATVDVTLQAEIAEGWHLYSLKKLDGGPIPTTLTVPAGQPFRLAGPILAPPALTKFEETFQMEVESYEDSAAFTLPVAVPADAAAGPATLRVEARYQACDNSQCLPPRTVRLELPLVLE